MKNKLLLYIAGILVTFASLELYGKLLNVQSDTFRNVFLSFAIVTIGKNILSLHKTV